MQIKRLAALSLAAIITAAMLTGCPWDIEDDASSVTSSPSSSSSSSRPSYDDEDDDDDASSPPPAEPDPENPETWPVSEDGTTLIVPEGASSDLINSTLIQDGITSLDLPNSLTSIGASAFEGCTGLTSVYLPDSLTSIGAFAFMGCTGLTSIRVGTGIIAPNATIGKNAFDILSESVTVYYPNGVDVDELKKKLQEAGLKTNYYEPETKMLQTAPAAPGGVKELLDTARLFGL